MKKLKEKEKMKKEEEKWIKKFKTFLKKQKNSGGDDRTFKNEEEPQNNTTNIYMTQNNFTEKNAENMNQSKINFDPNSSIYSINNKSQFNANKSQSKPETNKISLLNLKPSPQKPLGKNEMFIYFKNGIFNRDPQKNPSEKIVLILEEFNQMNIVKCNKSEDKPFVYEFDLKLYTQMNIRNMNEILNYKKFIMSRFREYVLLYFGSFLSVVIRKEYYIDSSLVLGYLFATNVIKKMSEIQKYDLPMPKDKEFFYPLITKEEIDKVLNEAEKKRKEKMFILDGNNRSTNICKKYNPLLDKNLLSYMHSKNNIKFLSVNGFVGKNGKIIYDPIYKETLKINNDNSPQNYKKILCREHNLNTIANTTNKFLIGYKNKTPGYSIYRERKPKNNIQITLPAINKKTNIYNYKKDNKDIIEEKSEENNSKE
jgi:hypothetical protein